ncbi:hypothetical protein GDO86_002873 [Hymenochirus boettgeri]|uniref:Tetratricopeptide repeat domain 19 n=1 Tax=Hymenochirus boettgeri TaxID=247094 RepID=A0A8T2K190_9PIPI|nr:hypothetical protein GDO86_002873 [Hymenochirus boettgeri]
MLPGSRWCHRGLCRLLRTRSVHSWWENGRGVRESARRKPRPRPETFCSNLHPPTCGGTPGGAGGSRSPVIVMALAAFSFFSNSTEKESEEEVTESESKIIFLLKKAKLNIMKGEMEEAEEILHEALHLAHKSESKRAIIYTYDLMANLALLRGKLDISEKLFKQTMVYMLDGGAQQDDDAFIEISLKLACIYGTQNKNELAVAGFQFCIMSLEEKLEKELPEVPLSAEEKSNTRLLLGLCLDSYGRFLLNHSEFSLAQNVYEKALKICREEQGSEHPQTVILMNDLATVLEAKGNYDEAFSYVQQASELARKIEHPEQHVVHSNLAMILMYQGKEHFAEVERIFKEALKLSEKNGDTGSVKYIQEGLAELDRRKTG